METSINLIFKTIICLILIGSFSNCNNKKTIQPTTIYNQIEPQKKRPTISGKWKLDSIVWTDNTVRGKKQTPFSTTIWSFSADYGYVVEIYQNQYDVSIVENNTKQKTSIKAQTPSQKFNGSFKENNNKLTTTILGGNTEYLIVKKSDSTLHLKSQRHQVLPVSEEEKGKIAEHYFSNYTK